MTQQRLQVLASAIEALEHDNASLLVRERHMKEVLHLQMVHISLLTKDEVIPSASSKPLIVENANIYPTLKAWDVLSIVLPNLHSSSQQNKWVGLGEATCKARCSLRY